MHHNSEAGKLPLSLYIHLPWCVRKCPYCDFNSHQLRGEIPENAYIDALLANLQTFLPYVAKRQIQTIFMGGGTPSLISAAAYQRLLSQLQQQLVFANDIEITLEANPGAIDEKHFQGYFQAGINRLSIGAQSFQPDKLTKLGRIHQADEISCAVQIATQCGFTNFNIDLMFGLPNQTIADALFDLQCAMSLNPTHISWYQLTLEPNTYFYKHPPKLPDDDYLWQMQQAGQALLAQNNYLQYEISAYAKNGHQAQHNLNYWRFGDYIGLGAGAHSKFSNIEKQTVTRFENIKVPKLFMQNATKLPQRQIITEPKSIAFEFMLNQLRLNEPLPITRFKQRTGFDLNSIHAQLKQASDLGLLVTENDYLTVTTKGQRYLNELLELFLPE